jgi:hypothetical protein
MKTLYRILPVVIAPTLIQLAYTWWNNATQVGVTLLKVITG